MDDEFNLRYDPLEGHYDRRTGWNHRLNPEGIISWSAFANALQSDLHLPVEIRGKTAYSWLKLGPLGFWQKPQTLEPVPPPPRPMSTRMGGPDMPGLMGTRPSAAYDDPFSAPYGDRAERSPAQAARESPGRFYTPGGQYLDYITGLRYVRDYSCIFSYYDFENFSSTGGAKWSSLNHHDLSPALRYTIGIASYPLGLLFRRFSIPVMQRHFGEDELRATVMADANLRLELSERTAPQDSPLSDFIPMMPVTGRLYAPGGDHNDAFTGLRCYVDRSSLFDWGTGLNHPLNGEPSWSAGYDWPPASAQLPANVGSEPRYDAAMLYQSGVLISGGHDLGDPMSLIGTNNAFGLPRQGPLIGGGWNGVPSVQDFMPGAQHGHGGTPWWMTSPGHIPGPSGNGGFTWDAQMPEHGRLDASRVSYQYDGFNPYDHVYSDDSSDYSIHTPPISKRELKKRRRARKRHNPQAPVSTTHTCEVGLTIAPIAAENTVLPARSKEEYDHNMAELMFDLASYCLESSPGSTGYRLRKPAKALYAIVESVLRGHSAAASTLDMSETRTKAMRHDVDVYIGAIKDVAGWLAEGPHEFYYPRTKLDELINSLNGEADHLREVQQAINGSSSPRSSSVYATKGSCLQQGQPPYSMPCPRQGPPRFGLLDEELHGSDAVTSDRKPKRSVSFSDEVAYATYGSDAQSQGVTQPHYSQSSTTTMTTTVPTVTNDFLSKMRDNAGSSNSSQPIAHMQPCQQTSSHTLSAHNPEAVRSKLLQHARKEHQRLIAKMKELEVNLDKLTEAQDTAGNDEATSAKQQNATVEDGDSIDELTQGSVSTSTGGVAGPEEVTEAANAVTDIAEGIQAPRIAGSPQSVDFEELTPPAGSVKEI